MRNQTILGLTRGALLLAAAGCARTSSPGSSSSSGPVPLNQLDSEYAQAFCTGYGNCCGSKGFAFNLATCIANVQSQINLSAICASPHVYDAQAAGDCMADIQSTLSSCGNTGVQVPVCASMCTGTAAPGASCAMNWDCASSDAGTAVCELAMGDTSATNSCKLEVHATVGDSCNQTCAASSDGNGTICTYLNAPSTSVDLECYVSDGLYCAPDAICRPLVGRAAAARIKPRAKPGTIAT